MTIKKPLKHDVASINSHRSSSHLLSCISGHLHARKRCTAFYQQLHTSGQQQKNIILKKKSSLAVRSDLIKLVLHNNKSPEQFSHSFLAPCHVILHHLLLLAKRL